MPASTANPNGLDYFRRKEPLQALRGKVSDAGFDFFLRREPDAGLDVFQTPQSIAAAASTGTSTTGGVAVSAPASVLPAGSAGTSTTGAATIFTGIPGPVALALVSASKPPNPNNLDYFRRGEPAGFLIGKVSTEAFDFYRRSEPAGFLATTFTAAASQGVSTTSNTLLGTVAQIVPAACASVSQTGMALAVLDSVLAAACASVSVTGGYSPGLVMSPGLLMSPSLLMQGFGISSNVQITVYAGLAASAGLSATSASVLAPAPVALAASAGVSATEWILAVLTAACNAVSVTSGAVLVEGALTLAAAAGVSAVSGAVLVPGFTLIRVTGTFMRGDGTPAQGTVIATLSEPLVNINVFRTQTPAAGSLNASGQLVNSSGQPFVLAANDDPATSPPGSYYAFALALDSAPLDAFNAIVSHNAPGGTVDLSALREAALL